MSSLYDEFKAVCTTDNFTLTNPFMINRFLSFAPATFYIAQQVNMYSSRIPRWAVETIYRYCIKMQKAPWIKYAKKNPILSKEPLLRTKISETFCCNDKHAIQTIQLLRRMGKNPESYYGLKKGE